MRSRAREPHDKSVWVLEERRELRREASDQRFDRIAFALRALRILKPRGLTVAVYERRSELTVERGRDWSSQHGSSWAMVGIPRDASREHIAVALAELSGRRDDPYMIETLLAAGDADAA